jgi:hypothetical protein
MTAEGRSFWVEKRILAGKLSLDEANKFLGGTEVALEAAAHLKSLETSQNKLMEIQVDQLLENCLGEKDEEELKDIAEDI